MSLVFFGTGSFAVPALRAVHGRAVLVVTQPDRPSGRGMRLQPSPVRVAAEGLSLPIQTPENCRAPEFVEHIKSLQPLILLVAAYGQILPLRLLETAEHGGINLHGSILPKYRGAAPIQRAIMNGETETGVTLMQMAKGMDTGDIIDREITLIGQDETYGELQDRLAEMAAAMSSRWLAPLEAGDYPRTPQNDAFATVAPKIERAEGLLDFSRDAASEYRRFRAVTPNPGAFLESRFGRIRVSVARLSGQEGNPGTVSQPNLVAFKDGSLELVEVQPEGKKRMSGRDFFNGARLRPGDSLIGNAT